MSRKTASQKLMEALAERRKKRAKAKAAKAKKQCPLAKGDVIVAVYHAATYAPLKGVPVSLTGPTGGAATTDKMGLAEFLDRDPGAYSYRVDYAATRYSHDVKSRETDDFQLPGGSILIKRSTVAPISAIKAVVKDDLGAEIDAPVSVSIAGPLSITRPAASDPHAEFRDIPSGKYKVAAQIMAPADDAPQQFLSLTPPAAEALAPERGSVSVELIATRVNVARPKVTAEADFLPLAAADAAGEAAEIHRFLPASGGAASHAVRITLGIEETAPAKPWDMTGVVAADRTVSLWLDRECTRAFAPAGGPFPQISNSDLRAGKTLWAKGEAPGEARISLVLKRSAKPDVLVRAGNAARLTVGGRVTPKVEVEHLVVLMDRGMGARQRTADTRDGSAAAAEDARFLAQPVRVDLSATVTPGAAAHYNGEGKLTVAPARVEIFADEDCKTPFDPARKIALKDLKGAKPLSIWLRGKTAGKFRVGLEMDPSTAPEVKVAPKAEGEMGCVELKAKLHHYVEAEVNKPVNPDVADAPTYWNELKGLDLQQKEMTDAEKAAPGRMLHVQKDEAHTRAKLIVAKVEAAHWPDAAKDYVLRLDAADGAKTGKKRTGSIKLFDAGGAEKPLAHEIPLADAKAAAQEFWIEGAGACEGWRGLRLSLGMDRPEGGPAKTPKMDGDWAALTVVKIKTVTCSLANDGTEDYFAGGKVFINLSATGRELKSEAGKRRVEISAELEPKLEGVELRFQVVEHETLYRFAALADPLKNTKIQNLKHTLRPVDRPDRKKLLHVKAETDANGKAKTEALKTGQLNLVKFKIGAYLLQDADQARYIDGHPDLKKYRPVMSADWVEIWQRLFFKVATMKRWSGASYSDRFDEGALTGKMAQVGVELKKTGSALNEAYEAAPANFLTWARAALGGQGGNRTMYLCLISGRGDKGDLTHTFNIGAPTFKASRLQLNRYFRFRDLANKATWLDSCHVDYGGVRHDLVAHTTVTQTADFAFRLDIDYTSIWNQLKAAQGQAVADDFLANGAGEIKLKEADSSSGVSWHEAVVVCMDTREPNHATQDAKDSASHTMLHEIGHYVGLAAKFHPDHADTLNPYFYSEHGGETSARGRGGYGMGPHCDGLNDQCIMWYMFKMTHEFCDHCKTHMRARLLHDPKVAGRDKF